MNTPHEWHGDGPPLVLIAGLGAKGTSWHPFLERAAKHFRVLTFDNRGSGRAAPIDGPLSLRDLAYDLLRLLDAQEIERIGVVGRSMGGMIAQELALLAPERVARLVLVSTAARSDVHLAGVFELWARMAEAGVPAEIRHQSSLYWCVGREALERDERVRSYLFAKARADRPADYAVQARACARHDLLEALPGVSAPTLVVSGTDDRLTPVFHAEELAKAIPGARLAYIAGAGHLAYLEAAESFNSEVLGFLGEDA